MEQGSTQSSPPSRNLYVIHVENLGSYDLWGVIGISKLDYII